ncbi:hypothetical protein VNO78_13783 [Psophocarpus tetragonolobus]|uniref:Uncharacterized protein n=1 Tax=Psophocarpus tetragonolobus TaxID=3891 RepID=A0AAN9XPR2_PSOTE
MVITLPWLHCHMIPHIHEIASASIFSLGALQVLFTSFPKEESELIPGLSHFSKVLFRNSFSVRVLVCCVLEFPEYNLIMVFYRSYSMILKDLMEEKQLNLNQPLLSVRRFSSTVTSETAHKSKTDNSLARLPSSPAYNSELKSCPVRNAGTIPFLWEKAPGKPKDESKLQTQAVEQPPISTPNFPPGRVSQIKQQSVPEMRTGSNLSCSQSVASLDKKATNYSKRETKEKEGYDYDDGHEAYEYALDSLSRTESFFMGCSVSDLSGWDEQEVQPYGIFSNDHQQARDCMINRFLSAAQPMTSKAPQYASKKALVGKQKQKQKKKEVVAESSCILNQHRPKPLLYYTHDIDREESEDESDDCNEYENYTTSTCGLFPRFCLLNPIPGLKMVDKVQRNAAHGVRANSAASHIESTKEQARTPYGFTEEKEILDILVKSKHGTDSRQRGSTKLASCESTQRDYESPAVEKTLYVDSVHKVKSQTNNTDGDFETLRRNSGIYDNPSIDSSPKVCKKISSESQVYNKEKNSNILTQNSEVDLKSNLAAKWVNQECTVASSKVRCGRKIDLERECIKKLSHQEISGASCFGLPLALPSLKGPSESWLKRTLPTISKRNMTSQSNLTANIYTKSKIPKTTPLYPKWEAMVKSSNAHHGHLQLPEMGRKFVAIFDGGHGDEADRYKSMPLFMIFMSLWVISMIIFACGVDNNPSRRRDRGLSRHGGDGGIGGSDGGGGGF